jgi:hypothetical protein
MNQIDPQTESNDALDAQRDIIRGSLNEIVNDIGMAMRDVGLTFPVYMTVRNSGDALVTIATTLDPSSADWQRASGIVCRILEEKFGCCRLRGQELPCAIANAGVINAADVTADWFDSHRSPAVSIVPLRGFPGAASFGSAPARMCLVDGLAISK